MRLASFHGTTGGGDWDYRDRKKGKLDLLAWENQGRGTPDQTVGISLDKGFWAHDVIFLTEFVKDLFKGSTLKESHKFLRRLIYTFIYLIYNPAFCCHGGFHLSFTLPTITLWCRLGWECMTVLRSPETFYKTAGIQHKFSQILAGHFKPLST